MTGTVRYRVTNCHFALTIEGETKKAAFVVETEEVHVSCRQNSSIKLLCWQPIGFSWMHANHYFDSCVVLNLHQWHHVTDIAYSFGAYGLKKKAPSVACSRSAMAAHLHGSQNGRRRKKWRARNNVFYTNRLSYKNSVTALINGRNAVRSDASPLSVASANEVSPTWSRRTGRACGASFSPHTSSGLVAEICCTIVEKPEQLV